jgi:transaldolase
MKFFIDTANLEQIQAAADLGILDGVTTNPSLMSREGIIGRDAVMQHYATICNMVEGDVSAEVISTDYEGMIREAEELVGIAPNIVIKVPVIKEGIRVIKTLSDRDIRTNCTLIFSAGQALLAAKAGASYISPFIGRIDDINLDGMDLIKQIAEMYAVQFFETEILAASIRSSKHIVEAALAGADVVTAPLKPILGLLKHPLTDIGLAQFLADYKKVES